MKTSVKTNKDTATFSIKMDAKEYLELLDKLVDEKIKTVEMDGFRKGKMPRSFFMKKYGYDVVIPDSVDQAINQGLTEIVTKNNLDVIGQFEIDWDKLEADKEKGFNVTGSVAIMPVLVLEGYKEAHEAIKKPEAKVTKKAVKEAIDGLLADKAIMEIKEGKAEEGDTVVIDFVGSVGGEEFAGGKGDNYPLELGSGAFIPGFEDQLIGSQEGDVVDVKVTFPENYGEPSLAGKDALFKTTVHEVKTKKVPKLTDDIVKEIRQFDVETKEALEEAVEQQLKDEKLKEINIEYSNKVFEKITKDNKVTIPEAAVESQLKAQVKQIEANLAQQGMSLDLFLQLTNTTKEAFEDEIRKEARERVRNSMIINAIMAQEKIKTTAEEYKEYIKQLAEAQKTTQKDIKEQIEKLNIEAQIKDELAVDKTIKLILGE